MFKYVRIPSFFAFVIAIALCDTAAGAQAPTLITAAINEGQLVAVTRSTHPSAKSQFDRGPAPDNLPLDRMLLVLKRSPDRQAALDQFLQQVQEPSSPNYHKWLTPEQFGQEFGAADVDIQVVSSWLQGHGFQVQAAPPGRGFIEFSGTAGQVRNAFHTQIHKFTVNGVDHWANASNQQIPVALADAVAGVSTLHNFHSAAQSAIIDSHVTRSPDFTSSSGDNYLAPHDYSTIYNVNPLYPAITGAGTVIAVVGRTNINVQDIISFRSLFGLPANPPNIIVNGTDPGDLGGGEEAEAVLDTSWAGALATGATVDLVVSASTNTTDGADLSEAYIINNNLGNVMTESFGSCEAAITSAQENLISSSAEQAAAEGITYTVSAGDSGSAGCDDFNTETSATGPVSVNGLASTPYDIAVGGTQFNENGTPSLYWSSTNNANYSSALSYIPEDVWNANCAGSSCGTGSILSGGGGASVFFAKPSWQTGVAGIPADGVRDLPDVALTAAGHDAYLLCLDGSCSSSPASLYAVYGTSASAPSFASIVALLNQKVGSRLGQLTPRLYALAAAENLSACNASNTSGLPASNCILNDVTIGTNAVPGEANYNTSSETYLAGVGYDRASGLGSVNVANLVNNWSGTVVTAPSASLSPTALTFPTQTDGTISTAQSITLSNSGTGPLSIASIAVSGTNASEFTASNNCGATLAAGANCSISISFAPAAPGNQTANLVVTDNSGNAAGSTQSATLKGTGAAASTSSATYKGADATTLGNWTGIYGSDGQMIANGLQNIPSYASVSLTGDSTYTWTTATSDPRAVQQSSGSTSRVASVYFSTTTFTMNLNLTDGNTHKISLYLCDWDNYGRAETVTISDAASGTVLNTESFSAFSGGIYETWLIKGNVNMQVTRTAGNNGIVNALFFDPSTTTVTSSASYGGLDTTTQGSWTGKYGADGQVIANGLQNIPAYAKVNFAGDSTYTWTTATTDPRAVQQASGSSSRIASVYFSATSFTIAVNLTDGNPHKVSLYLCDWDSFGRAETISILDAATGTLLNTQSFSSFVSGEYASWTIKGNVEIQVTRTAGNNGVVNALFFDPPSTTGVTSSATYSGLDATTQGTWTGKYGADGQMIANGLQNAPAYANVSVGGDSTWTWTTSTTDARAVQQASGSSSRIASVYFSPTVFTINVNLTDGNTHKVSLYLCDWDNYGRAETISIVDAGSGTVLDTESYSSFVGGVYASWTIKGNVQIQITRTAGNNGVVNAIFFDTDTASAAYAGADTTTQGTWTGKYGADGQIIANSTQNIPAYANVSIAGDSTWTWTTSTSDPRALQTASGSSTRIASVYFSPASFTINVNLTDGNTHRVSLYLCDWDSFGRAETISILDPVSGKVLDTEAFSSFAGGVWAPWNIKGNVQIKITFTAGNNAVVNGIFFN